MKDVFCTRPERGDLVLTVPIPNHHGLGFRIYDIPAGVERWPLRRWTGKVFHGEPYLVLQVSPGGEELLLLGRDGVTGWLNRDFLRRVPC